MSSSGTDESDRMEADIRLEAKSGMYINPTFSYRLDAKKLQMYCFSVRSNPKNVT